MSKETKEAMQGVVRVAMNAAAISQGVKDLEHRMDRVEMVLEEMRQILQVWWADRNYNDQADPDEDDAADAMLERANR